MVALAGRHTCVKEEEEDDIVRKKKWEEECNVRKMTHMHEGRGKTRQYKEEGYVGMMM